MSIVPEPTTSGSPIQPGGVRAAQRSWLCSRCGSLTAGGAVFCQHCGALAPEVEEELRARGEPEVVEGLKVLQEGDETRAYQIFVAATEQNPRSEAAWYWRARTAETVDEVIRCLEELLQLNPSDTRAQQDLEQARLRKQRADALAAAQAAASAASPGRPGAGLGAKLVGLARRVLLDLGSLAAFLLGLVWGREVLLEAANGVGIPGLAALLPTFRLPRLLVPVPLDTPLPALPSRLDTTGLIMVAIALGYLSLAFRLAEGSPGIRGVAVAAAVLSAAAALTVVGNGQLVLLGAAVLAIGGLLGRSAPGAASR